MRIILASKSGVRKEILDNHDILADVSPSNVDEDQVKDALLEEGASPEIISKNLAELKSIKVSSKNPDHLVIGADSVISLNLQLINKPNTDKSELKMKELSDNELITYLNKIKTETLKAYGVYQIEAEGIKLFEYIKGDKDSIMGLPIKQIKDYINNLKI